MSSTQAKKSPVAALSQATNFPTQIFFVWKKKEKFCVRLADQGSANKKPSLNDVSDWVLFVYTSNLLDKYIAYYMFYMAIKFVCLDCPDRPRDKLHNVLLHSIVS